MHRNLWERSSLALALSLTLASPAPAQEPAQEMERPGESRPTPPVMKELDRMGGPERGPDAGEERGRYFEAKKRERLLKALHLDEATQSRLSRRLEELDQKGEDLRRQRKDAFEVLREQAQGLRKGKSKGMKRGPREGGGLKSEDAPSAAGPAVDGGALKQTLDRVYAVEDAIAELWRERVQALRDILTPEQQVAYLFNTMKLQKDLRKRLQRERDGAEGGPPDRRRRSEGGGNGERQ